jgi:hypothetical protein
MKKTSKANASAGAAAAEAASLYSWRFRRLDLLGLKEIGLLRTRIPRCNAAPSGSRSEPFVGDAV